MASERCEIGQISTSIQASEALFLSNQELDALLVVHGQEKILAIHCYKYFHQTLSYESK
jgi:hypothetical protein